MTLMVNGRQTQFVLQMEDNLNLLLIEDNLLILIQKRQNQHQVSRLS